MSHYTRPIARRAGDGVSVRVLDDKSAPLPILEEPRRDVNDDLKRGRTSP